MTFNDKQVEDGNFTVRDMQNIIYDCEVKSKKLGVWLRWKPTGNHITGRIKKQGKIIWEVTISTISVPYNLCRMYVQVNAQLTKMLDEKTATDARLKRQEEEREKERRIAAMPGWGDRIKGQ